MISKSMFHWLMGTTLLLAVLALAFLDDLAPLLPDGAVVSSSATSVVAQPSNASIHRLSWAEYRIIDIHAHIGNFREYDLSLPTLLHNVESYGIRLALVSNIDGAELPGITPN